MASGVAPVWLDSDVIDLMDLGYPHLPAIFK
jgi:hypothetical protein